jgi:hypothetical protein
MMDNGDSLGKVIAFDAMATWLLELKNRMLAKDQENHNAYEASRILSNSNADRLIHYVWNYWDDPVDALQHRVSKTYVKSRDRLYLSVSLSLSA